MTVTRNNIARWISDFMYALCILATAIILGLLVCVTGYLLILGGRYINTSFFTQLPIPAGANGFPGGMLNALAGSIVLVLMASLVGIPLGILAGIYLSEYDTGSRLVAPARFIADVLAGVPS